MGEINYLFENSKTMSTENTSNTIRQIMGQAISSQARRFTYCLIDDTSETKIGTAIAIQLGNQFFLATASHVIENTRSIKALMHDKVTNFVSNFIARHCDSNLDLGILEIYPPDSQFFDEFLSKDRLCETIEDEQEIPALIIGFPCQFCNTYKQIELTPESLVRIVRCDSLTFHTIVLPYSKWPSEGLPDEYGDNKKLVIGRDMLIDFNHEHEVKPFTPKTAGTDNTPVECPSLDPRGMSGGGIWLAQIAASKEKLHSPDARLIGLQLGWHRTKNLLRGIRIGAWLDLVRNQYPDLMNKKN
jgi:hypothetical protein